MTELIRSPGCDLDVTDFFCGAGGASTGLAAAGFRVVTAANHWDRAIETHAANHPGTEHLCADINNLDMRRIPRTRVLWASVICTEVSPAGGNRRKPTRGQMELMAFGPISQNAFIRTRATALDVIRASEVHRYDVVVVENVADFALKWELFSWWRTGMQILGYTSQILSVSSAHIGGDGASSNPAAPQWRDRIYVVFTRTGIRPPDLTPRPLAWCRHCREDVTAVQAWRTGRTIGKYAQQYDYRCPNTGCRRALVEPYVRPAAAAIDWTNLGTRIGDRKRPLAATTRARIAAGLAKHYPDAITATVAGNTYERRPGVRTWPASTHPLTTLTTTATTALVQQPAVGAAAPLMVTVNHAGRGPDAGRTYPADALPLPTRTIKIGDGIVIPAGAFIDVHRRHATGDAITAPLATVTASHGFRHHSLVIPYRRGTAKPAGEPMLTLATRDSAGLATVPGGDGRAAVRVSEADVDACLYRMITPREQLTAQRFPDTYVVHGNQGEQTMQAGNAVSVNVAHWIGQRIAAALDSGDVETTPNLPAPGVAA